MRDKFLTEAMGLEWHEQREEGYPWCTCSRPVDWPADKLYSPMYLECASKNMDFSTWQDFGKLWEWAEDQKWWDEFVDKDLVSRGHNPWLFPLGWINPNNFANAVYNFLVESTWQARE